MVVLYFLQFFNKMNNTFIHSVILLGDEEVLAIAKLLGTSTNIFFLIAD